MAYIDIIKPATAEEIDKEGKIVNRWVAYDINFLPIIRFQHIGNGRYIRIAWLCWGINITWYKKTKQH